MRRVTVVGRSWARAGQRFLNEQPCEVAGSCPIAKACQNLEWDREYEVVSVRPLQHGVCGVHDGGAQVVEVEDVPLAASLERAKTRGTMVRWAPPVCRFRGCGNWDRCFPRGLTAGQEYALDGVEAGLDCPMGYDLVGVVLGRPRR